jgi:hypothetical protein
MLVNQLNLFTVRDGKELLGDSRLRGDSYGFKRGTKLIRNFDRLFIQFGVYAVSVPKVARLWHWECVSKGERTN